MTLARIGTVPDSAKTNRREVGTQFDFATRFSLQSVPSPDGFQIAQRDLALRGPGEVLGTKQTGELSFRVADLIRDSDILPDVQKAADLMMREHKDSVADLITRWVGAGQEYGKV